MNYVLGFAFHGVRQERVLLYQKPTTSKVHAGLFNGPGGKVKEGERLFSAMVRECLEETGELIESWDYILRLVFMQNQVHVFRAFNGMWKPRGKGMLLESGNLPFNAVADLRWMIPMVLDLSNFATILRSD